MTWTAPDALVEAVARELHAHAHLGEYPKRGCGVCLNRARVAIAATPLAELVEAMDTIRDAAWSLIGAVEADDQKREVLARILAIREAAETAAALANGEAPATEEA